MVEEKQGNNFAFSLNNVNDVEVQLKDVCEPKDDNVIEVEVEVEVELDSIIVERSYGCGRGRIRGCDHAYNVKQNEGNNSGIVAEGSALVQSSGGWLTSDVWKHFKSTEAYGELGCLQLLW